MAAMPCDVVQEYEVPPGVTAVRIEAESSGSGGHSSSAVTRLSSNETKIAPRLVWIAFGSSRWCSSDIGMGSTRQFQLAEVAVLRQMFEDYPVLVAGCGRRPHQREGR